MDSEIPILSFQQAPNSQVQPGLQNELIVVRRAGRLAVRTFLDSHNCFAVLKASTKVVVFDTRIPIQLAFYALVEHDMLSAPIWDPVKCQFVGLLTVTDFIDILLHYRLTGKDVASLAVNSITEILTILAAESELGQSPNRISILRPFQGAGTDCSLRRACEQLLRTGQDFLPVVFTADMRVLACITYTNILEHLVTHFREQRRLFDDSVADLGIGTYGDKVVTVTPQHTLADALQLMHSAGLSALPVVDATTHKVIGVYSRSDITFLTKATDAEDAVRNLDLLLEEILSQGQRDDVTTPDALRTCSPTHTLQAIFESFAVQRFNRLCVVDADERLLGLLAPRISWPTF